jgi:hypothetical protein
LAGATFSLLLTVPLTGKLSSDVSALRTESQALEQQRETLQKRTEALLQVAQTLVIDDVTRAESSERRLRQIVALEGTDVARERARDVIAGELRSSLRERAAVDDDAFWHAAAPVAAKYTAAQTLSGLERDSERANLARPLYFEQIYVDAARAACASAFTDSSRRAELEGQFEDLHRAALESDDIHDAWQGPYIAVHKQVEAELERRTRPSATQGEESGRAQSGGEQLRLCDAYLERFASLRLGRMRIQPLLRVVAANASSR